MCRSAQAEEQELCVCGGIDRNRAGVVLDGNAIGSAERFACHLYVTGDDLKPDMRTIIGGRDIQRLARIQTTKADLGVLPDRGGAITTVAREEQRQRVGRGTITEILFRIARFAAIFIRLQPDLIEVREVFLRRIEFAVMHTATRAHVLEITGLNRRAIAHAVLVGELTFDHISEDLHVGVRMRGEATARLNRIVVHHPERLETHVIGIEVFGKRKRETGLEPAMVGLAALIGGSLRDGA